MVKSEDTVHFIKHVTITRSTYISVYFISSGIPTLNTVHMYVTFTTPMTEEFISLTGAETCWRIFAVH